MKMMPAGNAPSTRASRDLLPVGEKVEVVAAGYAVRRFLFGMKRTTVFTFAPMGRRWPAGPDERALPVSNDNNVTKRRPGKTRQARNLRKDETEEELRLWSDLRDRRLNGHKFARQIPLGPYIVDFLCRTKGLIVEIDGSQHAGSRTDLVRTRWLNTHGYAMLRFWNYEVLQERQMVLEMIVAALEGRISERDSALGFYPAIRSRGDIGR